MSAAVYIPVAKVLDVWGRAEGFLIMTVFATLGLVLMAASNSLASFCAAYVSFSNICHIKARTLKRIRAYAKIAGLLHNRLGRDDLLRGCDHC